MEMLVEGTKQFGLTLSPIQVGAFKTYFEELLRWNQRMNLTAITEEGEIQVRHFLDSLSTIEALRDRMGRPSPPLVLPPGGCTLQGWVIDVGTGAGFPGMPLRLVCPAIHLTLLDSSGKKTSFLRHLVNTLGVPDVEIVTARAEDLGREDAYRERYDVALSRALATLPVLVEYCLPLLRIGGVLVAQKKGDIEKELKAAETAIQVLGGRWRSTIPVCLPGIQEPHYLVVVDKISPTPPKYPRRAGVPTKRPIMS